MSINSKMTAIADAIRAKTGGTAALTLDQMATEISNISGGYGNIPTYHYVEAGRVADKILAWKEDHKNSLIFGAVSDIHVSSSKEHTMTASRHAGFALETVSAMVGADFVACLGDNCDENGIDDATALQNAKYSINALKPAFERFPSHNLVGNHEKCLSTQTQYDLIGVWNDFDVAASTQIRGFGYKDYTSKKVRVIVLHTNDYLNGSDAGFAFSYEQKDFLMRALDLSSKSDAASWQILLLSHFPMDWNGGNYNTYADIQTILKAYEDGTTASITVNSSHAYRETPSGYATYSGGKLVYNYSGKNTAKLIANIHGHIHTNKVSKIANTNIARVATANTNPDRNSGDSGHYDSYGDYSITSTAAGEILKGTGNARDTSATFYCIDLNEQKIYAFGYGADADREIEYTSLPTFTVRYELTNCYSSNTSPTVVENSEFNIIIYPSMDGTTLSSVAVTMGGIDVTSQYYNPETNCINIPAVTGNIVITAKAKVPAWSETITDISVAIRSVWQMSNGVPSLANSNTEAAIGVIAGEYGYTDRESNTVCVMPVDEKACDVVVNLSDSIDCTYRFIGLVGNNNTFTTAFTTSKLSTNTYSWATGSINYILISMERKDGSSWPWSYDDKKVTVTFTNGVTGSEDEGESGGGNSGNTPTYKNIIDEVGTVDNVRLRSGGATGSAAGFASNYFSAKGGNVIRVKFPNGNRESIPSNGVYCCTYSDTNGTLVAAYDASTTNVIKNLTSTGYEVHIPSSANCSYARVAGGPNGKYAGWIVTVNEPIE